MKLHEDVMEYEVWVHGSEYVEPYKPIIGICPECQSGDIRETTDEDGTSADLICNACGCKFDSRIVSKTTRLGKTVHVLIQCIIGLLLLAILVCMFGGLIWFNHKTKEFGGNAEILDAFRWKAMIISIGGPILCGALIGIMAGIDGKI